MDVPEMTCSDRTPPCWRWVVPWAVVVVGVFFVHNPVLGAASFVLSRTLLRLAVGLVFLVAAVASGRGLLRRLGIDHPDAVALGALSGGLGLALVASLTSLALFAGPAGGWAILALVVWLALFMGTLERDFLRSAAGEVVATLVRRPWRSGPFERTLSLLVAILLLVALANTQTPPVAADSHLYHVGYPREVAMGRLPYASTLGYSQWSYLHDLYVPVLIATDDAGPRTIMFGVGLLTLASLVRLSRLLGPPGEAGSTSVLVAQVVFLSTPLVAFMIRSDYLELPLVLFQNLALLCLLDPELRDRPSSSWLVVLFCICLAGVKRAGLLVALPLLGLLAFETLRRQGWRRALVLVLAFGAGFAWHPRNLARSLWFRDPRAGVLVTVGRPPRDVAAPAWRVPPFPAKRGGGIGHMRSIAPSPTGNRVTDLVALPFSSSVSSSFPNNYACNAPSPLYLALAPVTLWFVVRPPPSVDRTALVGLVTVAGIGYLLWVAPGILWLRYLAPTVAVLAVLVGAAWSAAPGAPRRGLAVVLLIACVPLTVMEVLRLAQLAPGRFIAGLESAESFFARATPGTGPMVVRVNDLWREGHLTRVLALGLYEDLYLEAPVLRELVSFDLFLSLPTAFTEGPRAFGSWLDERGVSHVVVSERCVERFLLGNEFHGLNPASRVHAEESRCFLAAVTGAGVLEAQETIDGIVLYRRSSAGGRDALSGSSPSP